MGKDLLGLAGVFLLPVGFYVYGIQSTKALEEPEITVVEYQELLELEKKNRFIQDDVLRALSDSKITPRELDRIQAKIAYRKSSVTL